MHAASMSFSVFWSIWFSVILPEQDPHSMRPRADQVSIFRIPFLAHLIPHFLAISPALNLKSFSSVLKT